MKLLDRSAIVTSMLGLALPLTLLAGCPMQPLGGAGLPEFDGIYWVEQVKDELVIYELPDPYGDPNQAMWYALQMASPEWYTGPALYETDKGQTWTRLTLVDGLTLEAVVAMRTSGANTDMEANRSLAGVYWVEYRDATGELALYRLPTTRDDDGVWTISEMDSPLWFSGAGLYECTDYFAWTRLTSSSDLTLDDVLMVHDFGPRPPGDPAQGAPSGS